MKIDDAKGLVDEYYEWLKAETAIAVLPQSNWLAVSTPFIGRFNDTISFYMQQTGEQITISDDGDTLNNIFASGGNITRGKLKSIIERIKAAYGIGIRHNEIHIKVNRNELVRAKHRFISALIELNDIEIDKGKVKTDFHQEVDDFLYDSFPSLTYTPYFTVRGESGLEYTYDFQCIERDKEELFIKTFNRAGKNLITPFLYSYLKLRDYRPNQNRNLPVRALAILNDTNRIDSTVLSSIENDGADYLNWSLRHEPSYKEKLRPVG